MDFIVDFSIERGFRSFSDNEDYKGLSFYNFYVIQVSLEKDNFIPGNFEFYLINNLNNDVIFSRSIFVDIEKKIVITPNSHEDPLIESDEYYMLCFQLWDNDINKIQEQLKTNTFSNSFLSNDVSVILKQNDNILCNVKINQLSEHFKHDFLKRSAIVDDYYITTTEDCIFRVHLGYEDGSYEEIESLLKKGEKIGFHQYLNNPYVGLQCSYEYENVEVEEKHIVVGLKSMTLSGLYRDNDNDYHPLLPFKNKYQILFTPEVNKIDVSFPFIKEEKWNEINTIKDLVDFYKNKNINFFESSFLFLEPQYRKEVTYGLNKVFSSVENNKSKKHIDLEVCKGCNNKTKCIQIVPSNLSYPLFRENLHINDEKECIIYHLLLSK